MNERRILIADDESPARARLRRLVEDLPGYTVCAEATSGDEALREADRTHPDIVLLDIRMPGMDGMTAAERFNTLSTPPALIFCTAYDHYAMDAIRHQAAAYLLKPVRQSALLEALEGAARTNRLQQEALTAQRTDDNPQLSVRSHRGLELIDLASLYYCMADSKYVTLVHSSGDTLCDFTLKELEADYPGMLLRIHRNTLVNHRYVRALRRNSDGGHSVLLNDPDSTELAVSRRHVPAVRQWLDQKA